MKKYAVLFVFAFVCGMHLRSQSISGVINIYTPVTQIGCNYVTVASTGGFVVGDRVLLIQMKGATLDQTNTSVFGSVLNYNESGNYEFANITSISGLNIYFQFKVLNAYNPAGRVQLVRVMQYTNVSVNGTLTCAPWNGTTGGILAFEVSGTLTLNSNINVSGKGFRGGVSCSNPDGLCGAGYSNYFYQVSSGFGAEKGEGICVVNSTMDGGRGAWANGGGGGNKHNSGGGGGGNFSAGGVGGMQANFCPPVPVGGVGGYNLNYAGGKIFLGGGGGCSDNNNQVGTVGTNGGGIVIIKAATLNGNNDSIISNGPDVPYINNGIGDGAGGAGAGGTVLLSVSNYSSTLNIAANGGHGGDQKSTYGACFGPGGGGGTGVVCFSSATQPANATYATLAGTAGIDLYSASPCFNTSYGAQGGQNANGALYNLVLPEGNQLFQVNLGPDTNLCTSPTIVLNAGMSGATYSWSTGASTQTISVNAAGNYWVTVTQSGCTAIDTILVSATPTPVAGSNSPLCVGQTLNLTTSTISNAIYSWSGPNGFTSSQQNPSIAGVSSAAAGTYSVFVTVGSCVGVTATVTVSVMPVPLTPSAGNNGPICSGQTLNLNTGSVGGATYNWSGPNSFTSTVQNPTITPAGSAAAGTYSVTITVNGCASPPGTTIVLIDPIPATPTVTSNSPLCVGQNLNLTASSIGGATYNWTGPNSFTSTSQNPVLNAATTSASGTYSVTATVGNCTSAPGTILVIVNAFPSAPGAFSNSPVCDGQILNLTASPVAGAIYNWSGPNGFTSSSQNPSINGVTAAAAGTYSVSVTVSGCTGPFGTTQVIITPLPPAPVASNNSPACVGQNVNLNAGAITGATYSWSGPGGFTSVTQNPVLTNVNAAATGIYSVTVTVSGCTGPVGTTSVVVVSSTSTPILPADTNICGTSPLVINAAPNLPSYNWSTGATTNSITVSVPGVYWLSSTINNCPLTDSISISFTDLSGLSLGPDIATCDSSATLMSNLAGINYAWSTGAGSQQITVTQSGTYVLNVSQLQCFNSDTVRVSMLSNTHVSVPNIVTPNGDGLNDNMKLINLANKDLNAFSFIIYNRWGIKMFETNRTDFVWNNGKNLSEADDGTYYWVMEYSDDCAKKTQTLKGFITFIK